MSALKRNNKLAEAEQVEEQDLSEEIISKVTGQQDDAEVEEGENPFMDQTAGAQDEHEEYDEEEDEEAEQEEDGEEEEEQKDESPEPEMVPMHKKLSSKHPLARMHKMKAGVSSPTDNLMSPTTQKIKAKREHLIKRIVPKNLSDTLIAAAKEKPQPHPLSKQTEMLDSPVKVTSKVPEMA